MPSPLAHSAAAYVWYRLFRHRLSPAATGAARRSYPLLLVAILFSLLPDMDSAAGVVLGNLALYHNNMTHSLFLGLGAALVVGGLVWIWRPTDYRHWFLFALLCYETHVLMDYLTVGRGVMALWPFSPQRYGAPASLFYGLHWSDGWLTSRHLWTLSTELVFAGLVILILRLSTVRRYQGNNAMRIGIMLRSFDELGGVGVYTRNLVQELLSIDRSNHYVFFYRNAENIGRFADYENVTERLVRPAHKALWDQMGIPFACWREKVDIVFHPKFTAPLLAPCKAVMVVHGADWFMPEQAIFYKPLDVRYIRTVMPLYFRKCAVVLSVSQLTTDNFYQVLRLPAGKIRTVYFGPAKHFRRVSDEATLQKVRSKYRLPDRFILTLTKRGGGERKNLGQIFKAFERYHGQTEKPHKLVIGGKDCHLFRGEHGIPEDGYGRDILFPGWIDQADLPAVYSQADLFLYPSNLEAFPIPITEAMACGTPIISSDVNGLEEIAGEAALLVDPADAVGIAEAVGRVLADADLQSRLSSKGLERSKEFSWEKCARETLAILEEIHASSKAPAGRR